jgi:2-oxo-4-hydroxy-4-carboxy-5-ureidoimidazoline decarboxylase
MSKRLPFATEGELFRAADLLWQELDSADWLEAFSHHPRIGENAPARGGSASTAAWSAQEQHGVARAPDTVLRELAKSNDDYYRKFGFIFLICATGRTAADMLDALRKRLTHTREEEVLIAAGEQSKITRLRLQKLLAV